MEAMTQRSPFLPGTGRGTIRRMVEGRGGVDPSTMLCMVPLPFRED